MQLRAYVKQQRGRAAQLAKTLRVRPVMVSQWCKGKPVPVMRCVAIERATSGEVTRDELRPDVDWSVFKSEESHDGSRGSEKHA